MTAALPTDTPPPSPIPPQEIPPPTRREKLLHALFQIGPVDKMLTRRAKDLYKKADMARHLKADATCLDVGSGSGHLLEWVAHRRPGCRCIGIDPVWPPTRRVHRRLNRHAPGRWQFLRADGCSLPFLDGSIDAAWMCFVLHHVPYDLQARILAEIARVLKPGGVFFLFEDTPADADEWKLVERWDRSMNFEPRSAPHFYRSASDWKKLLGERGFSLVDEVPFDRMIPQLGMPPVPHHALVFQLGAPHGHAGHSTVTA